MIIKSALLSTLNSEGGALDRWGAPPTNKAPDIEIRTCINVELEHGAWRPAH